MSKKLKPFKGQIYSELKKKHNSTNLFVDPEFPANFKSLHHTDTFNLKHLHIGTIKSKNILSRYNILNGSLFININYTTYLTELNLTNNLALDTHFKSLDNIFILSIPQTNCKILITITKYHTLDIPFKNLFILIANDRRII